MAEKVAELKGSSDPVLENRLLVAIEGRISIDTIKMHKRLLCALIDLDIDDWLKNGGRMVEEGRIPNGNLARLEVKIRKFLNIFSTFQPIWVGLKNYWVNHTQNVCDCFCPPEAEIV